MQQTNEHRRFDEAASPVEAGRSIIEASAGTGKTFTLVALFLRLVLEGKDARRLLVVTYTVAATEELTRRIRAGLRAARIVFEGGECPDGGLAELMRRFETRFAASGAARRQSAARLRQALADSGALAVFTIHGFCKHALEEWAFESGTAFRIDFTEEADDLLRRAAADCWHRRLSETPLLAEAAVALEWDVEDMLAHFHNTQRHPGTRIVPALTLGEVLEEVEEACARLRKSWDVEALRQPVGQIVWKKNAPPTAQTAPRFVQDVAAFAEGRLGTGLEAVRTFAAGSLRGHANKNRTPAALLDDLCAHAGPQACEAAVRALERLEHAFVRWFTTEVGGRFRRLKRQQRVMSFDDLLAELLRALEAPAQGGRLAAAIRASYDLALVDEFQDTDPRQYAIFKRIFGGKSSEKEPSEAESSEENAAGPAPGGKPVFLIGDAKQAIYRFRGADLHTYLDARREASRRFTLGKNWRSETPLVEAVNAVFAQAPVPFLHAGIPFQPAAAAGIADGAPLTGDGKAPLVWWYHPPEEKSNGGLKVASKKKACPRIIEATAREIVRLLNGSTDGGASGKMTIGARPLRASDIAVLVRTNAQAQDVQAALQRAGVPAVVSATRSVLDSREMAEIETLLRAVLEPRGAFLKAALATEMWGRTARDIYDAGEDAERWAARVRQFEAWRDAWQKHGVAYMLTRFLDEENVRRRLLAFTDGERRLTNVRHCVELLHETEQRRQQAPSGLMRWLARREEARILESDETELRLETDQRAVQVLTLHKSKGLEFGVVFCPFLWHTYFNEGQDPLVQTGEGIVYDLGSEERARHLRLARVEELAEELRLAYVGMTRAVHRCYVTWGDLRSADQSALGYLLFGGEAEQQQTSPSQAEQRQAETPAKRMAAAQKAARRAQANAARPDVLHRLFGENPRMTIEHIEDVEGEDASLAEDPGGDTAPLRARDATGLAGRLAPWAYSSYSAWTCEAGGPGEVYAAPAANKAPEEEETPKGLFAFAAGRRAGQCLHEILEHVDFSEEPDGERNARRVRRLLRRHRLNAPERHRSDIAPEVVVTELLATLRQVPLPGAGFTLADTEPAARTSEWAFSLPVGRGGPRGLRPAFAAHGGALAREYAPRLGDLDANRAEGFLRGTADLVLEHEGAYYLIDWKSNLLAERPGGYDRAGMKAAMLGHHYVLQYHLYAVALCRHLENRLPAFSHEEYFGGVWYVFLRGLQEGKSTGLFFDRPGEDLLAAINQRLGGA